MLKINLSELEALVGGVDGADAGEEGVGGGRAGEVVEMVGKLFGPGECLVRVVHMDYHPT